MNLTNEKIIKEAIMKEIEKDEYEYSFDPSYCSDEQWSNVYGGMTRGEGYEESITYYNGLSLQEIMNEFGDKYNYVIEQYQ
ncbi:hypothetical protein [Oceanobacillus oncorhynchi]|uniref:hypothetical protein n=1 Tax=Oceanobacillus oncorhynchi TaxID=545501 RepID=UPI0034D50B5D